jgi:Undecaprenyl-phosphate glucose phosphotransferase
MKLAQHPQSYELLSAEHLLLEQKARRSQRISAHRFAAILLIVDIVAISLSGIIPVLLYDQIGVGSFRQYLFVVCAALPLFLITSQALNLYLTDSIFILRRTLLRAVISLLVMFFGLMMIGIATKTSIDYSRVWFFSWLAASLLLVTSSRALLVTAVEAKLACGACLQRALIVSYGKSSLSGDRLALETGNRIRTVGEVRISDWAAIPDIGPYLSLLNPDLVMISLPWSEVGTALKNLKALEQYAVDVLVLPDTGADLQRAIRLRRIGNHTLLQIAEPPLAGWNQVIKRIEDLVIATLALVMISPLLLLTALAIRLDSKGPVLFKQTREGFNGELIAVWKFRSMFVEGTDLHASRQTSKNDPRVTRIGRLIRKSSIDELPQLWNVVQGEMSIVGPRPHALGTSAEGQELKVIVEKYAARHRVKPGITGWAQVNGARGELCSREQVKRRLDYDLYYIENWSLLFDIRIIIMTVIRMIHDPRAY